ncbi:nitroreductase family protein [Thalassolituus marinus]|uniref:Putative NAD(P)H nitroreductase n=1 Tax=Thalassolituus marinus TaxID=671053 RepID=A0ABS7ZTU4_9GAMM|nr:nitroreductase [Thalassolituus marinus]MCA6065186.1 nitroreductase [Thalassolituus marinus]
MNAIEALTQRVSVAQLTGPEPTAEQQRLMLTAALRAPDHAWLRPSRYLTVRGDARETLGRVFLESSDNWQGLAEDKKNKLLNMPMRAPLIIVAVCRITEHQKVPRDEQLLSTGAGVQNILNAAFALGLGAIWRTGDLAVNPKVAEALGLDECEEIVGFIYVGQINSSLKPLPELNIDDFVTDWTAKTS